MLFWLNSSLTILGGRRYFTLNINIAISCSLRLSIDGSSAGTKRISYDCEWELNTALSARSWMRSILICCCQKISSYAIPDGNMLSKAGYLWMICRLSVLHCMVSNFAVSKVHQLFELLYAKVTDIGEIKRIYFFPFCKSYSDIKRLQ